MESKLSAVIDTAKSKLCGIIDTAKSAQALLSQFEKLAKALIFFKEKINPRSLRQSFKNVVAEGTFLTHRYRWVNFEFDYLGEFEDICDNTLGCQTVAQGKMFDEKNRGQNLVRLSLFKLALIDFSGMLIFKNNFTFLFSNIGELFYSI